MLTSDEISKAIDPQLIGEWTIDPTDTASLEQIGKVRMIFASNNVLRYITEEKSKIQILNLTYWVEGEFIVTLQLTNLKTEKTKYTFVGSTLILHYDELKSRFLPVND